MSLPLVLGTVSIVLVITGWILGILIILLIILVSIVALSTFLFAGELFAWVRLICIPPMSKLFSDTRLLAWVLTLRILEGSSANRVGSSVFLRFFFLFFLLLLLLLFLFLVNLL